MAHRLSAAHARRLTIRQHTSVARASTPQTEGSKPESEPEPESRSARSPDVSASAQLWADAAREEAHDAGAAAAAVEGAAGHANWTGEEALRDAVLRMLVDKYAPLRGEMRTAEEKLARAPPRVLPAGDPGMGAGAGAGVEEEEPPAEHKPWLVTFRAPSHAANVKVGAVVSSPATRHGTGAGDRERADEQRRSAQAQRLTRAREATLDYRLGPWSAAAPAQARANPVSLKGWAGLVEERIERGRRAGHFRALKGRGQPLARASAERNPFIAREEFLMNRIVQRNGAAPPWVALQGELDAAVAALRGVLRQAWTRRAVRAVTSGSGPGARRGAGLTCAEAAALRDGAWEARERAYHDAAVAEVNALVTRYNGVAPYPVRRAPLVRAAELERVYRESAEDIVRGVAERAQALAAGRAGAGSEGGDEEHAGGGGGVRGDEDSSRSQVEDKRWLWRVLRRWLAKLV